MSDTQVCRIHITYIPEWLTPPKLFNTWNKHHLCFDIWCILKRCVEKFFNLWALVAWKLNELADKTKRYFMCYVWERLKANKIWWYLLTFFLINQLIKKICTIFVFPCHVKNQCAKIAVWQMCFYCSKKSNQCDTMTFILTTLYMIKHFLIHLIFIPTKRLLI